MESSLALSESPSPGEERLAHRKANGVHYTPPGLARFLAQRVVVECPNRPLTVLDPACGDGELLLAIGEVAAAGGMPHPQLFGVDTDSAALEMARARLPDEWDCVFEEADFLQPSGLPDSMPSAFEVIISNPPYVRTQALGSARSRVLASQFGLAGRVDLYHAFVAAIAQRLVDEGVMGLLCSNRFLSTRGGASTRAILAERLSLTELWDLGDTKMFDAAVLPAIVIGQRRTSDDFKPPSFVRVYETSDQGPATEVDEMLEAVHGEGIVQVGEKRYLVERGVLARQDAEVPWTVSSPDSVRWLRRVGERSAGQLGDVGSIRVGIKTTADKVFIRESWEDLPADRRPEAELIHPLLTHHRAARWKARDADDWSRSILYPHRTVDGRTRPVDLRRFPGAAAYLDEHRDQLQSREYVRKAGRQWYEIWVPHHPARWKHPKIVWPDISDIPRFFLDHSGAIVNGDCYWLSCEGLSEEDVTLVLAVSNSSFALDYYDACFGNRLYAGRRRFITQYVRNLPIPEISGAQSRHLSELVSRLRSDGDGDLRAEAEIDAAVAELFGIEEISR